MLGMYSPSDQVRVGNHQFIGHYKFCPSRFRRDGRNNAPRKNSRPHNNIMNTQTQNAPSAPARPTVSGSTKSNPMDVTTTKSFRAYRDRLTKLFGIEPKIVAFHEGKSFDPFLNYVRNNCPSENPAFVFECGQDTRLAAISVSNNSTELIAGLVHLNPWMRKTLWTGWADNLFIWMRIEGRCPTNRELLDCCVWLSEASIPIDYVVEPDHQPGKLATCGSQIQTVYFDQIKWPTIQAAHSLFPNVQVFHRS